MADGWWLYLLECRGGGIYTGIAKDVEARFQQHAAGKGAKYTQINPPLRVLASQLYPDHRSAAWAEAEMKRLKPREKWVWARALAAGLHFSPKEPTELCGSLLRGDVDQRG